MTNEDWKLDMLNQFWKGNDSDNDKVREDQKLSKKSSKSIAKIPTIDLHHFSDLTKQISVAEEAIDQAILNNHSGLIIIHGKGQGILRSRLIASLSNHQHIVSLKSIKDANNESGAIRLKFK